MEGEGVGEGEEEGREGEGCIRATLSRASGQVRPRVVHSGVGRERAWLRKMVIAIIITIIVIAIVAVVSVAITLQEPRA